MAKTKTLKLKQIELAAALGLSSSRVSVLKRAGMPVDNVKVAKKWRDQHLDPAAVFEAAVRLRLAPK